MNIDKQVATRIVREEAYNSEAGQIDKAWLGKVERLSKLCQEGVSATHIAFLATAMLAKAVNHRADLFAIKPTHASNNPNAYSARSLCHGVLVPLAAELGFSLGVTGREPLNNQPYFRMTRLGDDTPVHSGGRAAFNYMVDLVRELNALKSEAPARDALRAFIAVRRQYQPRYAGHEDGVNLTPDKLVDAIARLVHDDSEGGRRAQAVVAGLMGIFAGPERVESGRINDPSRKYPGDVCIRSEFNPKVWEKAIEVRDKRVSRYDVEIFGKKCVAMAVREAAVVMVSDQQDKLDSDTLTKWANGLGIVLTLFHGWGEFVNHVLFWSHQPKPVAANAAVGLIHQRLIAVEASPEAVKIWQQLVQAPSGSPKAR